MSEVIFQIFVVFFWLVALGTSVAGFDTGKPYRKVFCRGDRFDYKNVKCELQNSEHTLIGLHNVMFGYLSETVNCTEMNDTMGCEEQMSNTQMILMLEKGSAQQSITAVQFPAVDSPKHCTGYGNQPDYMAFIFECLKVSSITEMCNTSTKTGHKLSVYNPGYPAVYSVQGTHHCECSVSSPSAVIVVTIYDYRLNCTGNNQNLTIRDNNGIVLDSICDSFQNGQRNSSNQNLTIVWKGQVNRIGLFWIGFHAEDAVSTVTVDCYPIWDPTTTTTTSSTTSTTAASTTSSVVNSAASVSSLLTPNSKTDTGSPTKYVSSTQSVTTTTQVTNTAKQQRKPMPKTVVYALAAAGGGLFLVLIIVCVVVVKRRSNIEEIDPMHMQNMNTSISKEQTTLSHSGGSRGKTTENRRRSSAVELENKGNNSKIRRTSNNSRGTFDEKRKMSEQIQDKSKEAAKGTRKDSKPSVTNLPARHRESASSVTSKENSTPKKISRKVSETTDIDKNDTK
ncbi:uncharacterized protein LOC123551098 [Mercenaria mercenaria]|uniref:uncharacterized protein LOC123551098 n=1 Tax=Mercenaria mercenaria TaxID=6596 RepID=UPI001E1D4A15|nr:uncharacterized protein LOC123551098 [Mercenaria mercenaria]